MTWAFSASSPRVSETRNLGGSPRHPGREGLVSHHSVHSNRKRSLRYLCLVLVRVALLSVELPGPKQAGRESWGVWNSWQGARLAPEHQSRAAMQHPPPASPVWEPQNHSCCRLAFRGNLGAGTLKAGEGCVKGALSALPHLARISSLRPVLLQKKIKATERRSQ